MKLQGGGAMGDMSESMSKSERANDRITEVLLPLMYFALQHMSLF